MANFYVSLSEDDMASQIAMLLNSHNRLYAKHSAVSIKSGVSNYFVEIRGTAQKPGIIVGCVGLIKEFPTLSKIYHICTHPYYRRLGIARKLIGLAINNCNTEYVYMTIREDNTPSLNMASSMSFTYVNKMWSRDHNIIAVGRRV